MSPEQRQGLVERRLGRLSITRQCRLLGVSRSTLYYEKQPTPEADLTLMAALGRQFLQTPFFMRKGNE